MARSAPALHPCPLPCTDESQGREFTSCETGVHAWFLRNGLISNHRPDSAAKGAEERHPARRASSELRLSLQSDDPRALTFSRGPSEGTRPLRGGACSRSPDAEAGGIGTLTALVDRPRWPGPCRPAPHRPKGGGQLCQLYWG